MQGSQDESVLKDEEIRSRLTAALDGKKVTGNRLSCTQHKKREWQSASLAPE